MPIIHPLPIWSFVWSLEEILLILSLSNETCQEMDDFLPETRLNTIWSELSVTAQSDILKAYDTSTNAIVDPMIWPVRGDA